MISFYFFVVFAANPGMMLGIDFGKDEASCIAHRAAAKARKDVLAASCFPVKMVSTKGEPVNGESPPARQGQFKAKKRS